MLDVAIVGGMIYDGKSGDPFAGEVGIREDRIVTITKRLDEEAKKRIDATGKVVCPGFIDIHSHSDFTAVINPNMDSKLRQGVTTELVGNCGMSACPILGDEQRADLSRKYEGTGIEITWKWPEEYLEVLDRRGPAVNVGTLAGHGNIRTGVLGRSPENPTGDALEKMKRIAEECLRQGAFGLSTGLIYPPGIFSRKEEIIEVLSPLREHGGFYATHMRNEGDGLVEGVKEAIECAREAGVALQISHLKAIGRRNWDKIEQAFAEIEEAREKGLDVRCDRYPYIASSTSLDAVLPKWAYEGGDQKELEKLGDRESREAMKREILENHPEDDYWSTVIVSCVWTNERKSCEGKTLAEIAAAEGRDCCDVLFDILREDQLRTDMICLAMCEENLRKVLRKPYVMIGSDASTKADYGVLSAGKPHPRAYGTFPRVLGKYVREGMLEMGEAIAKMTSVPAMRMGLTGRGVISEGAYADIVVFDPETLMDTATFGDPHRYPEGIELVMVNGKVAVERGKFLGVRNGRVLRSSGVN